MRKTWIPFASLSGKLSQLKAKYLRFKSECDRHIRPPSSMLPTNLFLSGGGFGYLLYQEGRLYLFPGYSRHVSQSKIRFTSFRHFDHHRFLLRLSKFESTLISIQPLLVLWPISLLFYVPFAPPIT